MSAAESQSKRTRVEDNPDLPKDHPEFVTRTELEDLLKDQGAELMSSLRATVSENQASTLRKFDAIQTRKFEQIKDEIKDVRDRMDHMDHHLIKEIQ